MKILFATSECVPFVKTGGLADVCGALPKELLKAGEDIRVILPKLSSIPEKFKAKMLMHSMIAQEQIIMVRGNFFLCIFLTIMIPASRIKRPTAILIPWNACAITVSSRKLSRNMAHPISLSKSITPFELLPFRTVLIQRPGTWKGFSDTSSD